MLLAFIYWTLQEHPPEVSAQQSFAQLTLSTGALGDSILYQQLDNELGNTTPKLCMRLAQTCHCLIIVRQWTACGQTHKARAA